MTALLLISALVVLLAVGICALRDIRNGKPPGLDLGISVRTPRGGSRQPHRLRRRRGLEGAVCSRDPRAAMKEGAAVSVRWVESGFFGSAPSRRTLLLRGERGLSAPAARGVPGGEKILGHNYQQQPDGSLAHICTDRDAPATPCLVCGDIGLYAIRNGWLCEICYPPFLRDEKALPLTASEVADLSADPWRMYRQPTPEQTARVNVAKARTLGQLFEATFGAGNGGGR